MLSDVEPNNQVVRLGKNVHISPGCLTCKKRRLKCDLAKPSCRKCASQGLRCDAAFNRLTHTERHPDGPPNTRIILLENNVHRPTSQHPAVSGLAFVPETSDEAGHMALWGRTFGEMFATHSVCDGTILAVNLFSKTEPCIRHAAVAISSCHAALVRTNGAPTAAENEFTLTQYNKALRELNSVKHAPDVRVVLTLCSMLVVLEILLGRDDKWRLHLKNGTSIACRVKEEHGLEWKKIQSLYVSFERLYCHSSSFPGFGEAALCPQDQPQIFTKLGPPSIRSLPEAVANFMAIMKACLPFFQASNPGASYDYGRSRDQLIFHLEEWRDTFQLFKASKSSLFSQEEVLRAAMLDVNAEMLWIRLSAALASDELIWDQFDDRFRGLIQSLEEIVAGVKIKPWTLDWAGEVCETQPLFYIATKCRDRGVRWDALKLLFQCRGRHGCWDGGPLVLTAKRVVELEERGRVVWTSRDVPAEARFFSVLMEPNPADRRVVIKCFRAKTSGIEEIEEVLTW